jgi:hypothetical protein
MMPAIILAGLVLIAAIVLFLMWGVSRLRKLSTAMREKLMKEWELVQSRGDMHRKVLDAENVVDHALRALGYKGSFADKLKAAGPRFTDVQGLWNAHKLRNRIAHEMNLQVSELEAGRAINAFAKALKDLC